MQTAQGAVKTVSDDKERGDRDSKVRRLREQIIAGRYFPDPDAIADAMVERDLPLLYRADQSHQS